MISKTILTIAQVLHDLRLTPLSQFLLPYRAKYTGRIKIRAVTARKFLEASLRNNIHILYISHAYNSAKRTDTKQKL